MTGLRQSYAAGPCQSSVRIALVALLPALIVVLPIVHVAVASPSGASPSAHRTTIVVGGSTYHALAPVRVIDSSTGAGAPASLESEVPRSFQMAGAFGIPEGATAVAGTISIASPSHGGYVALTAVSTSPSSVATSTIDFTDGGPRSAGVTATLGEDGKLWALFEAGVAGQTVGMAFDLAGYYAPDATGATYHVAGPVRIFDSSGAVGGAAPLASEVPQPFQLAGAFGIPIGATAVTGTMTIANASSAGRVALTPESNLAASLATSTLSFATTGPESTGVTATLGSDGRFWAVYETGKADDAAQMVFDLTGYFTPDATGSTFHPLGPLRLIDSRSGLGTSSGLTSETPWSAGIVGLYGIPAGATAVSGTLTIADPTHSGNVVLTSAESSATPESGASLCVAPTDSRTTSVTAPLSADGTLRATFETGRPNDTVDIVFDLSGYFAPDPIGLEQAPAYFQTFGPFDSAPRDSDGVVQSNYPSPIGLQYNAVNICQAALALFDRWHSSDETPARADADRKAFFAQVDWLVANQAPDGRWLYTFPWGTQPLPWWSAMAEGQGMSVLLRAYSVTGDAAYLAAVEKARSTFDRTIADLGVNSHLTVSGKQLTVYQEYLPGYSDSVLNGWIFSLVGLYEDATYAGDPMALYDLVAADRGLAAVRALLPYYDTGAWTFYGLDTLVGSDRGPIASSAYHALHVRQLRFLYSITGDPIMKMYADRFDSYLAGPGAIETS